MFNMRNRKDHADRVAALKAFRDVGETFTFMQQEYTVFGHTEIVNREGTDEEHAALICKYKDFSGVIHNESVPYTMLSFLKEKNPKDKKPSGKGLDIVALSDQVSAVQQKVNKPETDKAASKDAADIVTLQKPALPDEPLEDEPVPSKPPSASKTEKRRQPNKQKQKASVKESFTYEDM